jgi:hypothetical protein
VTGSSEGEDKKLQGTRQATRKAYCVLAIIEAVGNFLLHEIQRPDLRGCDANGRMFGNAAIAGIDEGVFSS